MNKKLVSRKTPAGHDAGAIHQAIPAGDRWATDCGLTIGQYGVVEHQPGMLTCTACKRIAR